MHNCYHLGLYVPKVYRGVEELVASSGSYPEDRGFKSHPRYEFAKDVCPTNLAFWFFTIFSTNQKKMDFAKICMIVSSSVNS